MQLTMARNTCSASWNAYKSRTSQGEDVDARMSRSVRTCRICQRRLKSGIRPGLIPIGRGPAYLVHLGEGALLHLFERDDLLRLLVPREVHLAVPALTNLRHDVEHLKAELGSSLPERGVLLGAVGGPGRGGVRGGEGRGGGAGGEGGFQGAEAGLARREVGQEVKVVVVKV